MLAPRGIFERGDTAGRKWPQEDLQRMFDIIDMKEYTP